MNLENEYLHEKQILAREQETLAKFEAMDTESMTDEQLEARNRGIKRAKESIKESEELLAEIKEELVEFINNGGEVSEKTKEEIEYFESFNVDFKILSNRNPEIYVEGYVTINDENAEDVDWYFWDGSQYQYSQRKIHHDGIQITGSTIEQENEIAQFELDLADDCIWIDDMILQSNDDENRTYVRKDVTLIINDGAEVELTIEDDITDADYWATLVFRFNGEHIKMGFFDDDLCQELLDNIDDIYDGESKYEINQGDIEREISKYYWSDDPLEKDMSKEIEKEIVDKFKSAFARQLVLDAEICDKYGDVLEQCLDDETDDEWLFKFSSAIKNGTVDELIENEGFEIP